MRPSPAGDGVARAEDLHSGPRVLQERARPREVVVRDAVNRRLLAAADVLAVLGALLVAATVAGGIQLRPELVGAIPVVLVVGKLSRLYDRDELRINKTTLDDAPALFNAAVLYTLLLWLLASALVEGDVGHDQALVFLATTFALGLVLRWCARRLARRIAPAERCLLIGDSAAAGRLAAKVAGLDNVALVGEIALHADPDGDGDDAAAGRWTSEDLARLIADVDAHRVIVALGGAGDEQVLELVGTVTESGAGVSVVPRLLDVVGSSVEFDRLEGLTLLGIQRFGLSRSSMIVKRSLDVAGSALGLVFLSPLLAVTALAIKLDSPGPVLFRQTRVGREGRPFEMLKFRTMVDGADDLKPELLELNEADGLFKITADPRLTRVGRHLRRMSVDELPQLWNVLRAEMSLVGPRPLVLAEDEQVAGRHRRRLHLKPGMTGEWQVLGGARVPLTEMLTIDYLYAANWSLWGDVKVLLRTAGHVLARRGV